MLHDTQKEKERGNAPFHIAYATFLICIFIIE